ncbi:MAG: hypothetical protein U0704_16550 [Candidatus Eisenbacteria bacterium]
MASGMVIAALVVACAVGALALATGHGGRRRREMVTGRDRGISAFAQSLERPESDPVVQAVYAALVGEAGDELQFVRADDDLEQLWGIVEEDLDDVAVRAAAELSAHWSVDLSGHYQLGLTPRMLVEFLDQQSPRRQPEALLPRADRGRGDSR